MRSIILLVTLLLSLFKFDLATAQNTDPEPSGTSFILTFEKDKYAISSTYESNSFEMTRLNKKISPVIETVRNGNRHILIISHAQADNGKSTKSDINTAMRRAASVSKYLKNKYDLTDDDVAIYTDRSGKWGNSVHICLMNYPKPSVANNEVYFSTTQNLNEINNALKKYSVSPYIFMNNEPELSDDEEPFAYIVVDNKADIPYTADKTNKKKIITKPNTNKEIQQPSQTNVSTENTVETTPHVTKEIIYVTKESTPKEETKEESYNEIPHSLRVPSISASNRYSTFRISNVRVKTNILSWATVSPGISVGKNGADLSRGAVMPNLEVEYMFNDCASVAVGGTYSRFSYKNDQRNLWGISALSLEPRLWFTEDGRHNGANVGLRLSWGNFNIRDNQPLGYGRTGQFFSASAMLNYTQALPYNFFVEGGVGFGSRIAFDSTEYLKHYEDNYSETLGKYDKTQFMINFQLCIGYKFGY